MERKELIRTIYLYLFSLVGLVIVVIGLVNLVDLGLKSFVFTNADQSVIYPSYPYKPTGPDGKMTTTTPAEEEQYQKDQQAAQEQQRESERQRTASNSIAMLIVGIPLFMYHWKIIQKDRNRS